MTPAVRWRHALIGIVLLTLTLHRGSGEAAFGSTFGCRVLELRPRPGRTFHGEWIRGGNELILPDVAAGRLLRFDRRGTLVGSTGPSERDRSKPYRPLEIRTAGRELILDDRAERLVGLRPDLTPVWDVELLTVKFPTGDRIGSFNSFIVSGDDLIGMTVIVDKAGREQWSGIARMRLGASPTVERLVTLPSIKTPEGYIYYSHSGPYLAKAGSSTYSLLFGAHPHIERLLPARQALKAFPEGYGSPVLPISSGPGSDVELYRTWELSSSPVALFGRGQFLYLLARRPHGERATQWMLFKIDPLRDSVVHSLELPTQASDVVVVPGPLDWAIVEKGSVFVVNRLPEQVIGSAVFIPTAWIEDPNAPSHLSRCVSSPR